MQFLDENGAVWVNNQVQDVSPGSISSDEENLINSTVPRNITATPQITFSLAQSDCYVYLSITDIEDEISFTDQECLALEISVDSQCNIDIDNENECSILNDEVSEYNLVWNEECQVDVGEGIDIAGDENLEISYYFVIRRVELK